MATTTDYDAPRITADESLEDLHARRRAPAPAAIDLDEYDFATSFGLPDIDLFDEELTVAVVPIKTDEFRCARCFLVWHRSQRATAGSARCRDCS